MNKLILVSCDNRKVFISFVEAIANHITNVKAIDYHYMLNNKVARLYNTSLKYEDNIKLVSDIIVVVDKHNDKTTFDWLIKEINNRNYNTTKMFVRVNDFKVLNKLKRKYKRPIYTTLRINNTNKEGTLLYKKQLHDYKFDSRFDYVNNHSLKKSAIRFIQKRIPSLTLLST